MDGFFLRFFIIQLSQLDRPNTTAFQQSDGVFDGISRPFRWQIPSTLSVVAIKAAKSRDKASELVDSDGLDLLMTPSGGRSWRINYRDLGKVAG